MIHAVAVLKTLPYLIAFSGVTSAQVARPEALVYRTAGARELKAYVFSLPVEALAARTNRPAVLLFHGGGWNLGEASWVFDRAKEFAARAWWPLRLTTA